MTGQENFSAIVEKAKILEKKALEYTPYQSEITTERSIEFEPAEYLELTYTNMLNMYERTQKIVSTTGMGILSGENNTENRIKPSTESEEVESKIREMTTETLKKAEEISKEPEPVIELEKEVPKQEEPDITNMIELEPKETEKKEEHEPPDIIDTIEFEEPEVVPPKKESEEIKKPKETKMMAPPEPVLEIEKTNEQQPQLEVIEPKHEPKKVMPPVLRESTDELASKKYQQMEEQMRSMLGEITDELTLKKKMLELTKELFKEKTTSRREEIKLQITILKNMLVGGPTKKKGKSKAIGTDATHSKLLETILSSQQSEIAQTKDNIIDDYKNKITKIKKKFYEEISTADNSKSRKEIYDSFVSAIRVFIQQVPESIAKNKLFLITKHSAELKKLIESATDEDNTTKKKAEETIKQIDTNYDSEFNAVKAIVGREIENLIEVTGNEITKSTEEKPSKSDKKMKPLDVIKEINEIDDGTLLYYLHSNDQEYYKEYERKRISKAEAIFKAKALMAKEKGLSDIMVKKYFSQIEE